MPATCKTREGTRVGRSCRFAPASLPLACLSGCVIGGRPLVLQSFCFHPTDRIRTSRGHAMAGVVEPSGSSPIGGASSRDQTATAISPVYTSRNMAGKAWLYSSPLRDEQESFLMPPRLSLHLPGLISQSSLRALGFPGWRPSVQSDWEF